MMAQLTNVTHLPIGGAFLEVDVQGLESFTCLFNVVDGDGDVSKAPAGAGVAGCIALEIRIVLGAVVVREL